MLVFSFSIICTNLLFGSRFVVFLTNPIYFYFLADKIRSESMFFHSEFVVSSFCFSFTKLILHHFYAICELLCHLLQFSYFFSNHIFIYNVCISIHRNTDIRVPHDILSNVLFAFFELFVLGVCNLIAGRFLIPFPAYSITISLFPLFFVLILSSDFLCSWLICFRSPICIFTI